MSDAKPYPKAVQLARGERRYRRRVASVRGWQRLQDEKHGVCRVCRGDNLVGLHHLVRREDFGDDIADNLVPVCRKCHYRIHLREPVHCRLLLARLSDAEYAYMVERGGEDYAERVYGISYGR